MTVVLAAVGAGLLLGAVIEWAHHEDWLLVGGLVLLGVLFLASAILTMG